MLDSSNILPLKALGLLLMITVQYVVTTTTDSGCSLNSFTQSLTDQSYQVEVPLLPIYNTSHYKATHLLTSQCYSLLSSRQPQEESEVNFKLTFHQSSGYTTSFVHTIISVKFVSPDNPTTGQLIERNRTAKIYINNALVYTLNNARSGESSFVYNSLKDHRQETNNIRVVMKGVQVVMSMMAQSQRIIDHCDDDSRWCSSSPLIENKWSTCFPKEWKCNQVSECASSLDEKDCCPCENKYRCCEMMTHTCTCETSPDSCLPFSGKFQPILLNGCKGVQMDTLSRSYNQTTSLVLSNYHVIPFKASFAWPSPSKDISLRINYHCKNLTERSNDTITVTGQKINSMIAKEETYLMKSDVIPKITVLLTTATSCVSFTSVFRTETPRGAQPCREEYIRSCHYKDLCFSAEQHCNGILDCTNGEDEVGCGATELHDHVCTKEQIMCPPNQSENPKIKCYTKHQRCNGESDCTDRTDELNCDSTLCGTHNGTYLCPEKNCLLESWKCDGTSDCKDGIDEKDCARTTLNVITAAVIGSLACGILIVIAAGCSCRLYSHRLYESMQASSRYESPMTLIQNQLLRRAAPPPYQEAMHRSRPYEEVRAEYLAQLSAAENSNGQNPDTSSIASSSMPVTLGTDGEPKDEDSPELRTNDSQLVNMNNTTLIPKSDDEDETQSQSETTLNTAQTGTEMEVMTGRRRRNSTSSDISLLSRDSDDAPLI